MQDIELQVYLVDYVVQSLNQVFSDILFKKYILGAGRLVTRLLETPC